MRFSVLLAAFTICAGLPAVHAQWTLQDSHSTASLRGIHYVGNGIAWASGSGGTVLRTTDMGAHWQTCTVPDGDTKLDFRGVQAFDADTAVVMSSGTGDLSRLYKTTDGCKTWKLVFTNPDKDGFWDAIRFSQEPRTRSVGYVLGDPVDGRFVMFSTRDSGMTWQRDLHAPETKDGSAFAASNSSLAMWGPFPSLIGGGGNGAPIFHAGLRTVAPNYFERTWTAQTSQLRSGTSGSGVFAIETAVKWNMSGKGQGARDTKHDYAVAVGGDYEKPADTIGIASFTTDLGKTWVASKVPPHGYRSSVAYYTKVSTWITVGPNGTDISTDDGRNWRPLTPGPNDTPNADRNWNALSLPFVVGQRGRIGILRDDALKQAAK